VCNKNSFPNYLLFENICPLVMVWNGCEGNGENQDALMNEKQQFSGSEK